MAETLGNAIRKRRKKLKISMVELAKRLDMDRTYIHRIENEGFLPSIKIIEKIAKALEAPALIELYFTAKDIALKDKVAKQRKNLAKTKSEIIRRVKG